ncbi:hypothetical protein [Clostridium saccharobutylicum]|uniref:Integral membrane sensor signal transduction histidine kinase n=2 Tax=Clostridium saccharobutylicum TaxID=169679 RepID=U5MSI7_CLOSA|nr:hypothetical protein [Clostridium saccharobutylicum]AGX42621.1 integral membrane sensor signal transduction histidine kinase [Clostridium saccharobutylicum DSM 13864]AQR89908.1 hypothetical protein CLOSC_16150 [Clostridium saccharobutylicum]AQR99813.1 hypothetical protein CSACC_16220 [Clostridium saccharobutylicum]AQS09541.1 hypothetical protein CLOBY_16700 [Clostridium saccharobutylicum]AQS13797.1 hypothetical protein CLOSACC_16220 [Clostridium saccharobutylicum]
MGKNINKSIDKKHKHSKTYVISILAFLVVVTVSIGLISMHFKMKEIKTSNLEDYYEDTEFLNDIHKDSYVLYKNVLEQQQGKSLTFGEVYLKSDAKNNNDKVADILNNSLESWQEKFNNKFKSLNYLVLDKDGNIIKTNTDNNLKTLTDINKKNDNDIEKLKNIYNWYMVVNFNSYGDIAVTNVYGADEYQVRNRFSEFSMERFFRNEINDKSVKFNQIENVTFVYAIPKE